MLDDEPRYVIIVDETGIPLRDKVEGLTPDTVAGQWLLITDPDDRSRPAELLTLRVESHSGAALRL